MSPAEYLELSFNLTRDEFPEVETILERTDALSITTMDAEDVPILEPKPGETPLWAELKLTALFPLNKNRAKVARALQFKLGERPLQWQELVEQDWERAWLKDYEPIQFGQRLWVGPQDFSAPDSAQAKLFLDPGLAFGTGTHPTTYLCLEWLSDATIQDKTILDFGCGSGILALAALKLGAQSIIGTDIDPQALDASRENAKRNQIDPKQCSWMLWPAEHSQDDTVDILIANILANPLIELAPILISFLKPGSMIVLSGVLEKQALEVQKAYLTDIHWIETKSKDGWIRLVGQKKEKS